jgi:CYTH domain-containing protein|tara:strand:+ start:1326 stop:1832 length:507 start_codon:yes stop_codon:yes gene_type:complete
MIELEKTYLAKLIPEGLTNAKEMLDIYLPSSKHHPNLRIRKNGNNFEMTKKSPINKDDASKQKEHTIILTEDEFKELSELKGRRVDKIRYHLNHNGRTAEVDIFQGPLKGLVLIDFEFDNEDEKDQFEMPDFCLKDVTQELFIAGGMLCGKSYGDIEEELNKHGYQKL